MQRTILLFLIASVTRNYVSGLQCYECEWSNDPDYPDSEVGFKSDARCKSSTVPEEFLIDCPIYKGLNLTMDACVKQTFRDDGAQEIITRGCSSKRYGSEMQCKNSYVVGITGIECYCDTQGCNLSPRIENISNILFLLQIAIICLSTNF